MVKNAAIRSRVYAFFEIATIKKQVICDKIVKEKENDDYRNK